ncbi:histidinol-phosphatase HisJ family protein [Clostridium sp. 'White wine YQ']|uniref:histidinol-phosphatase HisJ family protein n=1 Tax=Clostridium sp. 'White wine YQ' TaxID=3027474 RepID=UPI002366BB7B|nr:histidinol-phosphatase HisJ family protein [Clostridium sp. 'White wine YQ']MDD7794216.1 histidinol-phosphatase HisJ family protein [Clostridium sp. 'White wine YQ']
MKKYFGDYHVHSSFSPDSKEAIENIFNKAKESLLSEICLTEHISMNENDSSYDYLKYNNYIEEVNKYNGQESSELSIKIGLEVGEGHRYIKEVGEYIKDKDIDFIIGSLHRIDDIGIIGYLEMYDIKKVYEDYFKELYEVADKSEYDVLGHLDLVQRYAWNKYGRYEYKNYEDLIDCILKRVIERGKGIEINTSILKNRKEYMPKSEIVRRYRELGGKIITVGSDAHSFERVGEGISIAYDFLKESGFKYISRYDKRKCYFETL